MRASLSGLNMLLTYDDREPTADDCDLIVSAVYFELADCGVDKVMDSLASMVHCINHNPGFFPRTKNPH